MQSIHNLYHTKDGWFDYPVDGAKRHYQIVRNNQPLKVHHADGTISLAYMFGESHFSYSIEERDATRKAYFEERARISERKALIQKFSELDTDTMKKLLATIMP